MYYKTFPGEIFLGAGKNFQFWEALGPPGSHRCFFRYINASIPANMRWNKFSIFNKSTLARAGYIWLINQLYEPAKLSMRDRRAYLTRRGF